MHKPASRCRPAFRLRCNTSRRSAAADRERPREAEAATLPTIMISRHGDGEVHRRYSAEFAVDLAGRLDVVGDGEADDAGGDLARRVDEALVCGARPVNFDQNIGAAAGGFAPAQHILARIVGVPPQDRVIEALSREFGHLHIEGRTGAPDIDPFRQRRRPYRRKARRGAKEACRRRWRGSRGRPYKRECARRWRECRLGRYTRPPARPLRSALCLGGFSLRSASALVPARPAPE